MKRLLPACLVDRPPRSPVGRGAADAHQRIEQGAEASLHVADDTHDPPGEELGADVGVAVAPAAEAGHAPDVSAGVEQTDQGQVGGGEALQAAPAVRDAGVCEVGEQGGELHGEPALVGGRQAEPFRLQSRVGTATGLELREEADRSLAGRDERL